MSRGRYYPKDLAAEQVQIEADRTKLKGQIEKQMKTFFRDRDISLPIWVTEDGASVDTIIKKIANELGKLKPNQATVVTDLEETRLGFGRLIEIGVLANQEFAKQFFNEIILSNIPGGNDNEKEWKNVLTYDLNIARAYGPKGKAIEYAGDLAPRAEAWENVKKIQERTEHQIPQFTSQQPPVSIPFPSSSNTSFASSINEEKFTGIPLDSQMQVSSILVDTDTQLKKMLEQPMKDIGRLEEYEKQGIRFPVIKDLKKRLIESAVNLTNEHIAQIPDDQPLDKLNALRSLKDSLNIDHKETSKRVSKLLDDEINNTISTMSSRARTLEDIQRAILPLKNAIKGENSVFQEAIGTLITKAGNIVTAQISPRRALESDTAQSAIQVEQTPINPSKAISEFIKFQLDIRHNCNRSNKRKLEAIETKSIAQYIETVQHDVLKPADELTKSKDTSSLETRTQSIKNAIAAIGSLIDAKPSSSNRKKLENLKKSLVLKDIELYQIRAIHADDVAKNLDFIKDINRKVELYPYAQKAGQKAINAIYRRSIADIGINNLLEPSSKTLRDNQGPSPSVDEAPGLTLNRDELLKYSREALKALKHDPIFKENLEGNAKTSTYQHRRYIIEHDLEDRIEQIKKIQVPQEEVEIATKIKELEQKSKEATKLAKEPGYKDQDLRLLHTNLQRAITDKINDLRTKELSDKIGPSRAGLSIQELTDEIKILHKLGRKAAYKNHPDIDKRIATLVDDTMNGIKKNSTELIEASSSTQQQVRTPAIQAPSTPIAEPTQSRVPLPTTQSIIHQVPLPPKHPQVPDELNNDIAALDALQKTTAYKEFVKRGQNDQVKETKEYLIRQAVELVAPTSLRRDGASIVRSQPDNHTTQTQQAVKVAQAYYALQKLKDKPGYKGSEIITTASKMLKNRHDELRESLLGKDTPQRREWNNKTIENLGTDQAPALSGMLRGGEASRTSDTLVHEHIAKLPIDQVVDIAKRGEKMASKEQGQSFVSSVKAFLTSIAPKKWTSRVTERSRTDSLQR